MKRVLSAACGAFALLRGDGNGSPDAKYHHRDRTSGQQHETQYRRARVRADVGNDAVARSAGAVDASSRAAIEAYLRSHLAIRSAADTIYPYTIGAVSRLEAVDDNVGRYSEVTVSLVVPAQDGLNPRDFTLAYDAVIHQIPNHFAVVQFVDDFRNGIPGFSTTIRRNDRLSTSRATPSRRFASSRTTAASGLGKSRYRAAKSSPRCNRC